MEIKNHHLILNLISQKSKDHIKYNNCKKKNFPNIHEIINENICCNFPVEHRNNIRFNILRSNRDEIILESNEINLPSANSLRRILLGEVETVAIENVFFYNNSSILNDENIAHRLGLIPIFIRSTFLNNIKISEHDENNKIIFEFNVKNSQKSFNKISVFSRSLKFKGYGLFSSMNKNSIFHPVCRDILILKLNPGQKVKCECHCIINSGNKHAKFSPVGTAFYKISSKIKIVEEILNYDAEKIFEICPVKVFGIKSKTEKKYRTLNVISPQFCTLCKECLKQDLNNRKPIRISRIKNKVTFVIESTGVMSPETLFHRAISLLVGKCNKALSLLLKSYEF